MLIESNYKKFGLVPLDAAVLKNALR